MFYFPLQVNSSKFHNATLLIAQEQYKPNILFQIILIYGLTFTKFFKSLPILLKSSKNSVHGKFLLKSNDLIFNFSHVRVYKV